MNCSGETQPKRNEQQGGAHNPAHYISPQETISMQQIQEYEFRPFGKRLVRVCGYVVKGEPKVAAELADNFLFSAISVTTADARRLCQQITEACDAAERAAAGLRKPL
jgi:hypothetical protein